jgi:hypothetical protein
VFGCTGLTTKVFAKGRYPYSPLNTLINSEIHVCSILHTLCDISVQVCGHTETSAALIGRAEVFIALRCWHWRVWRAC